MNFRHCDERSEKAIPWQKDSLVLRFFFFSFFLIFLPSTPALASQSPLPFETALETILSRSIAIQTQQETKEATESKNWSSNYSLLPSINLQATENLSKTVGSVQTERRMYGVTGSLNLIHFGADIAAMTAAQSENRAQAHLVSKSTLLAEEEGAKSLLNFLQAEFSVRTLEQNLKTRSEALEIGKERFRRGLFASQELDKLLVDRDNAQAQLSDSQTLLAAARGELLQLLDHDNLVREWPWKTEMSSAETFFKKFQTNSLSERPDWRAAAEQVEAAHARKRQNLGLALPSVDLSVTFGHADYAQPSPRVSGTEWQGLLTLSIPLFDRLANYGNYRAAVHNAAIADLQFEQIKRLARAEWHSAQEAFQIAYRTANAREQTLHTSRKLYETNSQRFRRGLINANELMLDQERLFQADLNAVRGWSEATKQWLKTCHSLGLRFTQCRGNAR